MVMPMADIHFLLWAIAMDGEPAPLAHYLWCGLLCGVLLPCGTELVLDDTLTMGETNQKIASPVLPTAPLLDQTPCHYPPNKILSDAALVSTIEGHTAPFERETTSSSSLVTCILPATRHVLSPEQAAQTKIPVSSAFHGSSVCCSKPG